MILHVVSIRDRAANVFLQPMFMVSRGVANRNFSDAVNDKSNDYPYHKHPDDYDLYELGTFDDNTGEFKGSPELLARGKDLVTKSSD